MTFRRWFGFEAEDHEDGAPAEYEAANEAVELNADAERAHSEYVRAVAEEWGFPLSNWAPTIPSHSRP